MAEETLLVPQTKPTYQCAALAELATAIDRAGVEVKTLKTKADPTDDEVKLLKLFGETPAGYTEDVNPMMCCWGMSGWFGEPRVPGQKAKDGGCCGCGGSTNANFYESFMAVLAGKDASGGGMNGCYGCCCLEPQRWEGETPIWKDDQNKQTLFQCLLGRPGILPQLYMKKGAKCYGPPFYCFVCPTGDTNPKVAKAYPGLVPIPDAFQWCGFIPAMCYGNQYGKYVPYAPYAPWDDWPVCCTNGCLLVHTNVPCCKCPKCPMCPVCPKIGVPGCPTIKLPACPPCKMVGFECPKLFCHTTFMCWPTFCPAIACLEHEMFTSEYKVDRFGPPEDTKDKCHNIQDGTNGVNAPKGQVTWKPMEAFKAKKGGAPAAEPEASKPRELPPTPDEAAPAPETSA